MIVQLRRLIVFSTTEVIPPRLTNSSRRPAAATAAPTGAFALWIVAVFIKPLSYILWPATTKEYFKTTKGGGRQRY